MEHSAIIWWKGEEVGTVSNITSDMWYLDADWQSAASEPAIRFASLASTLKAEDTVRAPEKGILAQLRENHAAASPGYVLVLSVAASKLLMRRITTAFAAYLDLSLMAPWQPVDDPPFYENALKQQVSFFHPFRWKKVRAVGIRQDRDEVLFEVANGRAPYAVVQLTSVKIPSGKLLSTHFFQDWDALYNNRLLPDHQEWKAAQSFGIERCK